MTDLSQAATLISTLTFDNVKVGRDTGAVSGRPTLPQKGKGKDHQAVWRTD